MSEPLQNWVIYNHPSDFPDSYVVRCWLVRGGEDGLEVTPEVWLRKSLAGARAVIKANAPGAFRLDRQVGDDPVIVEVWI